MLLAAAGHPASSAPAVRYVGNTLTPRSYGNHCLNYDLWDYSDFQD